MIVIKQSTLELLRRNKQVKSRLAYEWAKTTRTVERWFEENDAILTTLQSLRVITEETGLTKEEIIEEVA